GGSCQAAVIVQDQGRTGRRQVVRPPSREYVMEPSARPAAPPDTTAGPTTPGGVPGEPSWGSAPTADYRPPAAPGLGPPAFPQAAGPPGAESPAELSPSLRFRCQVLSGIALAAFAYLAVSSAATTPHVSPLLLALYGLAAAVYALLLVCLRAPGSARLRRL